MWSNSVMLKRVLLFILGTVVIFSCSKIEGQFAYKQVFMDTYRKMSNHMEFNSEDEVLWVFKTRNISEVSRVAVILLKKEVVWVEIQKKSIKLNQFDPNIHGKIHGLKPGEYKISLIVIKDEELLDEIKFKIYSEE